MSAPFSIGPGITIGGGIVIGDGTPVASFTVNPGDITFQTLLFSGYSAYSSAGFTSDGTQIYNGICYTILPALHTDILNAMNLAGLAPINAYVWHVSWTTGGTSLARVGLDGNGANTLAFSLIDQTDTNWQSGSPQGPTQTGTFTFPAVFTPYVPTTQILLANNWC
jgi:hypothetical protein